MVGHGVVDAHDVERHAAQIHARVLVAQNGVAVFLQHAARALGVGPVVVIAEHRIDRHIDAVEELAQALDEFGIVAEKVAGQ